MLFWCNKLKVRGQWKDNCRLQVQVVSDGVSSQLVKLYIFPDHACFGVYAPWSVNLPHQIGKHL